MTSRREFIAKAAAAAVVAANPLGVARADHAAESGIRSATLRDETILRLGGDGGMGGITWTADDRQLLCVCDGGGWPENPSGDYFNSRMFDLSGEPESARFDHIPGYPNVPLWDMLMGFFGSNQVAMYYGFDALAVDGHIYQYLSTKNPPGNGLLSGAKLIHSPDNGLSWLNQDGSSPVVLPKLNEQSRENMVFFKESQNAFSSLNFVQMGQDYQANRDGYVYVYSANGGRDSFGKIVGAENELVMFRVAKTQILNRNAYEYFVGRRAGEGAHWSRDIKARGVVHTFPASWTASSIAYNTPLGVYMLAAEGQGSSDAYGHIGDGGRPSHLSMWVAPDAWGPWKQILETAWTPAGDAAARATGPKIAPKWIAKDGKSFWLVWTDMLSTSGFTDALTDARVKAMKPGTRDEYMSRRLQWRQMHPYFGFNTQRVDLTLD